MQPSRTAGSHRGIPPGISAPGLAVSPDDSSSGSLDAVLGPSKQAVLDAKAWLDEQGIVDQRSTLRDAAGQPFYNTPKFTLHDPRARASRQQLRADFENYLDGFRPSVQDILENFEFRNRDPTYDEVNRDMGYDLISIRRRNELEHEAETNEKPFDAMKWLRETRTRIYEETKDMTFEERRRWSEERRSRDPWLSDWWNSMRKPDPADEPAQGEGR